MLPKALLAAALVASPAAAMLLPSTFGAEMHNQESAIHVKVPCPGCSLQVHKHHNNKDPKDVVSINDVPNHLDLAFSVEHVENDHDRLLLNGIALFPASLPTQPLKAFQFPDHHAKHHGGHREKNGKPEKPEENEKKEDEKPEETEKETEPEPVEAPKEEKEEDDKESPMDEIKRDMGHKGHREHKQRKGDIKDWEIIDAKKEGVPSPRRRPHHYHGKFVASQLAYSMQIGAIGSAEGVSSHDHEQVYHMDFQVTGVNRKSIAGIPKVTLIFVMDRQTNTIVIYQVNVAEVDAAVAAAAPEPLHRPHSRPHHGGSPYDLAKLEKELSECSNVFCRWKVVMESRLKALGSKCGGSRAKGHHGGPKVHGFHDEDGADMPPQHAGHRRPHHHHEDDDEAMGRPFAMSPPHHHHAHKHGLVHLVTKFVTHIVLPIMVGIASGLLVSCLGLAIGTGLYRAWHLVSGHVRAVRERRRGGGPAYQVLHTEPIEAVVVVSEVAVKEEGTTDEKAGLMSMPEPEPSQTELPSYEESGPKTTEN